MITLLIEAENARGETLSGSRCGANSIRYHPLPETAADEVTGERGLFCLYCLLSWYCSIHPLFSNTLPSFSLIHIHHCHFTASSHIIPFSLLLSFLLAACTAFLLLLLEVRLPRATPLASLRLQPYLLVPPIVLDRCYIACIPSALPVSTIPTIHYNT